MGKAPPRQQSLASAKEQIIGKLGHTGLEKKKKNLTHHQTKMLWHLPGNILGLEFVQNPTFNQLESFSMHHATSCPLEHGNLHFIMNTEHSVSS